MTGRKITRHVRWLFYYDIAQRLVAEKTRGIKPFLTTDERRTVALMHGYDKSAVTRVMRQMRRVMA